jgi:predicted neuraminidase
MKIFLLIYSIILLYYSLSFSQPSFHVENIFPYQEKHVHASSIVECSNGDFLVCWFHGSGERTADDVLVQGSRLIKGKSNWESVFIMADTPGFPDCNPVLFIDKKERLWLFWVAVLAHGWQNSILRYRISDDYMNSGVPKWSWQSIIMLKPGDVFAQAVKEGFKKGVPEEPMWAEYAPPYTEMLMEAAKDPIKRQLGWMPRIHPFVLPSGRILLPLYSDGFNLGIVAISDDNGNNWRASLPMVGLGLNQPSLVQKDDGTLLAYLRDDGELPKRVLLSQSQDKGETWSFGIDTDIPNPGSSLEVIELKDGRWVMVFNDTEEGRHRLAAALSDDEGATWKWKRYIAQAAKGKKSYSYPSVIQSKDGNIHVTYSFRESKNATIKHAVFDADWIME